MDIDFDIPPDLPDDVLFGDGGDELFNFDQEFVFTGLGVDDLGENGALGAPEAPPETYVAPNFFPFSPQPSNLKPRPSNFPFLRKVHTSSIKASSLTENDENGLIKDLQRTMQLFSSQRQFLVDQVNELDKWLKAVYPSAQPSGLGALEEDLLAPVPNSVDLRKELGLDDLPSSTKPAMTERLSAVLSGDSSRPRSASILKSQRGTKKNKGAEPSLPEAQVSALAGSPAMLKVRLKCHQVEQNIIQEWLVANFKSAKLKSGAPKAKLKVPLPAAPAAAAISATGASDIVRKAKPARSTVVVKPEEALAEPSTIHEMWKWVQDEGYFSQLTKAQLAALSLEPERTDMNVTCLIPGDGSLQKRSMTQTNGWSDLLDPGCCRAGPVTIKRRKKGADELVENGGKYSWQGGAAFLERMIAGFTPPNSTEENSSQVQLLVPARETVSDQDLDLGALSLEQRIEIQLRAVGLLDGSILGKDAVKSHGCIAQDLVQMKCRLSSMNRALNLERMRLRNLANQEIERDPQVKKDQESDVATLEEGRKLIEKQKARRAEAKAKAGRNQGLPW